MPRSYASDLLVDDFDLDGSRIGGYATRPRRRRSDILMMLVAAGASAAVLFNALAMQDGKPNTRPASAAAAPAIPLPPAAPAEVRKTVAAEPAPAAATPPAGSVPMSLAAAPPRPPVKPAAPPRVAAAPVAPAAPAPSAISLSNETTGTVRPPADVAVSPRVMEIQKALAKLGYGPIKVDGRGGDATKDAIERFERDRRLPVTGAISDRLVRELNAVAGFSIQ